MRNSESGWTRLLRHSTRDNVEVLARKAAFLRVILTKHEHDEFRAPLRELERANCTLMGAPREAPPPRSYARLAGNSPLVTLCYACGNAVPAGTRAE